MTVCVAALCADGLAIVCTADRMVGKGYVQAEPKISKIQPLHPNWLMLMSGNDISPVFEMGDLIRAAVPNSRHTTLEEMTSVSQQAYESIRMKRAEAEILRPIGWTLDAFNENGAAKLPNFEAIQRRLEAYELDISIIVAGFDGNLNPPGKIFTISSYGRGIPMRDDTPGFAAIGSGSIAAEWMMFFKDVGPKLPIRAAIYYVLEAKYFGELASGVGTDTDLLVLRFTGVAMEVRPIREQTIENKLIPICRRLEPQRVEEQRDIDVLNTLKELDGIPLLPKSKKRRPKK